MEQVREGADAETIVTRLHERGMEPEAARSLLASFYPHVLRPVAAPVPAAVPVRPEPLLGFGTGRSPASSQVTGGIVAGALLVGAFAAALGGAAWAAVAVMTDYESGFVAIGIGFVAGHAVVAGAGGRKGPTLQLVAVLVALLGIVLGKYFTYFWLLREFVQTELGADALAVRPYDPEVIRLFVEDFRSLLSGFDLLWVGLAALVSLGIPRVPTSGN